MQAAKGLSQADVYSYGQKLISKLLIVTMLLLDLPFVSMMQSAKAETINPNNWVTIPVKADPMMQGLNIPANAATQGMWSSVQNWPINGLHTAVLPNGRVLTYGSTLNGNIQDGRYFDVWDPYLGFTTSSHNTVFRADAVDSFCGTSTYINSGDLLISGGNGVTGANNGRRSQIFSPVTNDRTASTYNLSLDRWYATMITLPDSRPIILGGMIPYGEGQEQNPDQAFAQGQASTTPEVLESDGWRSLPGAGGREPFGPDFLRSSMPRAWVAPNGLVFGVASDKMWFLDPAGNGSIPYIGNYKTYSTDTPVNAGTTNTAVMYSPGKILIAGGNGGYNGDGRPASNQATVIDINSGTPVLTEQPNMVNPRRFGNSIVLANAQVVLTGGTKRGNDAGANTVFAAEIWTPSASNDSTGTWSSGASASIFRGYHSQTVLLPNGTILSTGGGAPGPVTNLNAEIYYPPYLFKSENGTSQRATRPVIRAISGLKYDNDTSMQMDMDSTTPISGLVLIGLSMGTHSFNSGQRRIPLSFTQEAFRVTTTIPNSSLTPPGYYQVVALDAAGVPSLGAIIAIGQNQAPPSIPANPYTPPDISEAINSPVLNPGGTANYSVTAISGVTYSWNFGDGSPSTPFSANPSVSKTYSAPGLYVVTLSARDSANIVTTRTFLQAVATVKTTNSPSNSTPITVETRAGNTPRIWVVNPDNDSVSVINSSTNTMISTINVGISPRTLAVAADGRIWVTNKESATISIISPITLAVVQTISLPRASQPHGIAFAPAGGSAYIALEATGQLLKLNPSTGAQQGIVNIGSNPRHVTITADGTKVLISRFITPPLPGESTASISVTSSSNVGGEVVVVNPSNMTLTQTIILHHSDKGDSETQGSGIPNYLAAVAISPDGTTAWVPSKQDNIKRGTLRSGQNLDFQNTVRAISSRINMTTLTEDYAKRVDHDNSSIGSAAAYHPSGVYMFVALETSRQVAVLDAISGFELFRLNVGRAPQGLTISPDGNTLYVQEFMDRSVGVFDLTPLTSRGQLNATQTEVVFNVNVEKLPIRAVLGKQLFYDAKDPRLARDSYMSCASCHNDAGQDGRVWDLTGFGEGLRNTIALKGRAAMGHGNLHWSANFDELQDFEGQIRTLSGGTGLMSDIQFNSGTRNQPLGDSKSGLSISLDDLATYLNSLITFEKNPNRNPNGTLTTEANIGKVLFANNCASCHSGRNFTSSNVSGTLTNIGTIKPSSGNRLGATLVGIDTPTLLDSWATAPYLHDGSASTLSAAVSAHASLSLSTIDMSNVIAYLMQLEITDVVLSARYVRLTALSEVNGNPWASAAEVNILGANGQPLNRTGWIATASSQEVAGENAAAANSIDGNVNTIWHTRYSSGSDPHPHSLIVDMRSTQEVTALTYLPRNGDANGTIANYEIHISNDGINWGTPIASGTMATIAGQATTINFPAVSGPSNVAPTVSLTAPTANAIFTQGTAITISATAADSDGTVSQVQFFDGPTLIGTDTTAPYSMSLANATVGAHSFTAVATDNNGTSTTSAARSVTVNAPANIAPTVALTAPAAGSTITRGATVTITATAADSDGTVARVEFYDGATLLGTDTTAPYAFSWVTTTATATGAHSLTARAYDNNGTSTTSAAVSVTVNTVAGVLSARYVRLTALSEINGNPWASAAEVNTLGANGQPLNRTGWIATASSQEVAAQNEAAANAIDGDVNTIWHTAWSNGSPPHPHRLILDMGSTQEITALTYLRRQTGPANGTIANYEIHISNDGINWGTPIASGTMATIAGQATTISFPAVSGPSNVAPTISLTAPTANAIFTQGTAITISATAADSDGTVSQVQFFDGPTLIGTDTTAPYSMSLANATVGAHSFTAVATDNNATSTTSAALSVTVEALPNVAPTISLTAPTANAIFTQGTAITISATAADSDGTVSQVQFFDGPTLIGTDTTAPYSMSLANATVGAHSFTAVATDNNATSTTSAALSVTVEALPNVAPTISLTAPTANAIFTQGTAITISATAADSDGTVSQVQFFDGPTLIGTDTTAPYSMSLANATVGAHSFTAVAADNNATSTTSAALSVTVEALPNVAPTISLTAPTANAIFTQGTAITISATAADSDGTVSQVQFFDGPTLIGTDTTAPYSMSLANATVGAHSFTAVATDNNATSTTSAALSVTVEALPNVAPTISLTAPTANAIFTQGTAITISATAADSDGTVSQVQFFDGPTLIGTDTTAPYSMSLANATVGAHSFTAVATDNNATSTTSAALSVTVEALPNVAPTISLTAPTANAIFTQGTAITISATAADSDGTVSQVQFFDGPTLIGTDTTAPYSMSLANATVGAHSFTAVATDNNATSTTSAALSVTVEALPNVAPTISLTAPTANAIFTQGTAITISATAADSDGTVSQVQFFDGPTLIGTDTTAPYSMSLANATVGAHSFTAVAADNNATSTTSAALSVTVEALPNVAPTISLTAPTANAIFTQGTAITISATAADSDGTVSQVQFFDGPTLIGTDTTAPYSMSLANATVGAHSFTAVATDNNGTSTTSAARSVTVNAPANIAPTVALTAPAAGSTITRGATVTITATAADSDGTVARVEFYDGATLLGTDTTAPYAFSWVTTTATATGAHSLTARAYDNNGTSTTSAARSVTVNAPANIAPTVALTAPAAGSTITRGATVTITATAADSDGTVARVEFYDGATLLGTDTTAPYAFSWVTTTATATGAHSLTARAYDNNGTSTTSAARSVTVNAPSNIAPTISLTAPTANAIFTQGTAITISATAADSDGTVSQVQFFDGPTLIGTDTTAPYSMSLANATVGAHSFTAVATDNNGTSTTSAAVSVTVNTVAGVLSARYVRLTALSEINGNPWASAAEVNTLGANGQPLNRTGWIATASSQEVAAQNEAAANAIDGDVNTIWHTAWSNGSPPHPHRLILDMGSTQEITALTYLRRQTGPANGTIANYEIHISNDGINWGTPIASGTMAPITGQVSRINF